MSVMKPIVFSDLDDTIFQTARKMADAPDEALKASHALNGSHSYMTPAQASAFEWLNASTRFIPVTARSTEALSRCALPFSDYQIASNGAVILTPEGALDEDWMARTRDVCKAKEQLFADMKVKIEEMNEDGGLRHWLVEEQMCGVYYCVKSNGSEARLDEVQSVMESFLGGPPGGLLFEHRNGNNLAYMPHDISKKGAVDYLIEKISPTRDQPIWGMGDSITDLPFMESCDMMVIPTETQLHKTFKKGSI